MVLDVDVNERVVRAGLERAGATHNVIPLIVGDFRFTCGDGTVLAVAERKTYADLASSISTGRYAEQRDRLMHYREEANCKIFYIIEGSESCLSQSKRGCVKGALENLAIRHLVPVIHTCDPEDTARALCSIHGKLLSAAPGVAGAAESSRVDQALPRTRKGK